MPLSARELLIIIRAKDQASRTVNEVGKAIGSVGDSSAGLGNKLKTLGAGMAAAGAGALAIGVAVGAGLEKAVMFGNKFDEQARLTLTQTKGVTDSLQDIKNVALQVAKEIPAPLEQLQPALFDIFSSMDVSVNEAKQVLAGMAKAAVAGGTDVQTAGRATIAILNGFHLPVSRLNDVLDIQFQMVAKGVGTYEEFAKGIGRAIPAASKAGQTIEELAGSLAFLTRNGLSVPMAATSMARAFDMLTNKKAQNGLDQINVSVKDAANNFRPLHDVVTDVVAAMNNLPADKVNKALGVGNDFQAKLAQVQELMKNTKLGTADRAAALNNIFGPGTGFTQQAQRFWALAIANVGAYKQSIDDLQNSHGTMDRAFQIMSGSWHQQWAAFTNDVKILAVQVRDVLMPYVEGFLHQGEKLIKWFDNLSPKTKEAAIKFVAIGAAIAIVGGTLLVITGILTSFVGTILASSGAMEALTIAVGLLASPIGALILPLLALFGVAIAAIIDHWDEFYNKVKNIFEEVWFIIQKVVSDIVDYFHKSGIDKKAAEVFQKAKDAIWPILSRLLDSVKSFLDGVVAFWDANGKTILSIIGPFVSTVLDIFGGFFDLLQGHWGDLFKDIENGWTDLQRLINGAVDFIVKMVLDGFLFMSDKAIGIFDNVFGWLPHFHEAMAAAKAGIEGVKGEVDKFFNDLANPPKIDFDTKPAATAFDSIREKYDALHAHIDTNPIAPYVVTGPIAGSLLHPVPHAIGGFIDRPEIGLLGESGRELVLPLNNPQRTNQLLGQAGLSSMSRTNITIESGAITVVDSGNPQETANLVYSKLLTEIRSRG